MGFKSEEDLDNWYAAEKEKLSEQFTKAIDNDKEGIPKHRARFDSDMKKLIARYNAESYKLLDYLKRHPKKE